ncbi:AfsR/SARP family transcriptional regulator [Streptomyces morookaense]|uniref:AfsR/SARP family transcriptional regulator n=1 Tax=Streptomyces morookaense TaxID=1970 RepID=UPI00198CEB68|nr:AfsR/SARP family transcriptional regulator [Streptomyces morookaense]GHF28051.1 SARP family transcriptional regulator [Streptomyces morookaense]
MHFRALGTFEVEHEGRILTPTAPKQRSVLALLALHHGGLVPISSLIEEIWPSDPPASAVTTLQTYVYQLRRVLSEAVGPSKEILVTKPLGYVANIAPENIDVYRFERLVESGKRELAAGNAKKASEILHQATGVWSGKALCDVHRGPLLEAHAARLDEAGLEALVMQAEADLRIGRHQELVGELRGLVAKHPWHEGLYAKLIVALYRCERRSQALEVYHEVRRGLDDELGIDPSPNLQQLYQAVLSDATWLRFEPAPRAVVNRRVAVPPAQLPADLSDFCGRGQELAELDRLLVPDSGSPQVVTVTGMPGVGKTALALHAAHAARSRFPDAQLYACLASSTEKPVDPAEVLHGFLRDLGAAADDIPAEQEGMARMFRTRVAQMKGLLVIDDARTADQIRPLLPGGPQWSVLVTGRSLSGWLPGSHDIVVESMDTGDGIAMLAGMVGESRALQERSVLAGLVQRCGGLPIALRALGERLAVNRHWSLRKLAARVAEQEGMLAEFRAADLDLCDYLRRGFGDLAPQDRKALFALGRAEADRFDTAYVASLLGLDLRATEDSLDRLAARHLLRAAPENTPGDPHYVLHPLLRAVLAPTRPQPARRPPHILPARRLNVAMRALPVGAYVGKVA